MSREKSSQKSTSRYESSSVPNISVTKNANELISTLHPTFIPSPDTRTRLADSGTLTTMAVHTTKTDDPGSASLDSVQETKSSVVPLTTVGSVNKKTHVPSSVLTTGVLPNQLPTSKIRYASSVITSSFSVNIVSSPAPNAVKTNRTSPPVVYSSIKPNAVSSNKHGPSSVNPKAATKYIVSDAHPC